MKHYLWSLFLTASPSFIQVTSSKYGLIIFLLLAEVLTLTLVDSCFGNPTVLTVAHFMASWLSLKSRVHLLTMDCRHERTANENRDKKRLNQKDLVLHDLQEARRQNMNLRTPCFTTLTQSVGVLLTHRAASFQLKCAAVGQI